MPREATRCRGSSCSPRHGTAQHIRKLRSAPLLSHLIVIPPPLMQPPPPLLFGEDEFAADERPARVCAAEWARQLTIIEVELFSRIRPSELLHQAWTKKDKLECAPNVHALIAHSNTVASWAASVLLRDDVLEARVEAFGHMVELVIECLKLNNFNAVFEVIIVA